MKAWWVRDINEDWGIAVHGETRAQAIVRARNVWPDMIFEWVNIRASRMPSLDDKPFTLDNVQGIIFDPDSEDGALTEFYNECDCPICKPKEGQ